MCKTRCYYVKQLLLPFSLVILFTFSVGQAKAATYNLTLLDVIAEDSNMFNIESVFRNALPGDHIIFLVNSRGGDIAPTIRLIDTILKSNAYLTTSCTRECSSAAAVLLLAGDEISLTKDAEVLFHLPRTGPNIPIHPMFRFLVDGNDERIWTYEFLNSLDKDDPILQANKVWTYITEIVGVKGVLIKAGEYAHYLKGEDVYIDGIRLHKILMKLGRETTGGKLQ